VEDAVGSGLRRLPCHKNQSVTPSRRRFRITVWNSFIVDGWRIRSGFYCNHWLASRQI